MIKFLEGIRSALLSVYLASRMNASKYVGSDRTYGSETWSVESGLDGDYMSDLPHDACIDMHCGNDFLSDRVWSDITDGFRQRNDLVKTALSDSYVAFI